MTSQTLARQIVEIAVSGMDKAEALVGRGMRNISQTARFAAAGVRDIATGIARLGRVAGLLGGGFLATFGRKAMENTVEGDRLGKSWEYLARVIGDQLAPYVRLLTDLVVRGATAFRELPVSTKQTIMQITLLTAAVGAGLALLPTLVTVAGALGAAFMAIASPAGLIVAGIAAIIVAGAKFFNFFRDESAITSEAVDDANKSWIDRFISYLEEAAVAGGKFFNWYAKMSAAASDELADGLSRLGEAVGLLEEGTTDQLRQMDKIKPLQIDTDKIRQQFGQVKKFARAAAVDVREMFANLQGDTKGFTVKMNVKFESLQGTFDRLQEAFARGDGEDLQRQQLAAQRDIAAKVDVLIGVGKQFGVVGN